MLGEYTENGYQQGVREERERLLARTNDIINAVVDYSLANKYDRVVADLTKIIMDESNE
jgi:hypothetical protein